MIKVNAFIGSEAAGKALNSNTGDKWEVHYTDGTRQIITARTHKAAWSDAQFLAEWRNKELLGIFAR